MEGVALASRKVGVRARRPPVSPTLIDSIFEKKRLHFAIHYVK